MTTPTVVQPMSVSPDINSQILVELGKINVTLAHMEEALKVIPDHEARIRSLEDGMPMKLWDRLNALERWRYQLPTALVLTIFNIVFTILSVAHVIHF